MVEAKIPFPYGDVNVFGNVARSVARIFHQLHAGIYLDNARTTGTTQPCRVAQSHLICVFALFILINYNCFHKIYAEFNRESFESYRMALRYSEYLTWRNLCSY